MHKNRVCPDNFGYLESGLTNFTGYVSSNSQSKLEFMVMLHGKTILHDVIFSRHNK